MPAAFVGDGDTPLHIRVRALEALSAGDALTITSDGASKAAGGPYKAPGDVRAGDVFVAEFTGGTLPGTVALVANGDTSGVAPTGAFVDTVTFTVANGVITAITLS